MNLAKLGFLILLFLTQIFTLQKIKKPEKLIKIIFWFSIITILIYCCFLTYSQYNVWENNAFTKNFLPPHNNISYFIFYALTRFFGEYILSLIAAIGFIWLAKLLNKRGESRFFYNEEIWLGGICFFVLGSPGWLFYFTILILIYFFWQLALNIFSKNKNARIPLYYLWIPTAISVILLLSLLKQLPFWNLLKL